jgi:hypothetical protein
LVGLKAKKRFTAGITKKNREKRDVIALLPFKELACVMST